MPRKLRVGSEGGQRGGTSAIGAGNGTAEGIGNEQGGRGWEAVEARVVWGAKDFREERLGMIVEKRGEQHYGEELRESEEQKVERLVVEMLAQAGWTEEELCGRCKGD
jgi:hypothetical protein